MQANNKKHYHLYGKKVTLRPYCRKYVPYYHQWFVDDPELLYLTGSEPLSLQEEFENHRSWLQDERKYTFIIFNMEGRMVGDVNLFFSEWIEPHQAEINIMIAVKSERGKGLAQQTLSLVEAFARLYYNKTEIDAKIKDDNVGSIKLFTKCGYKVVNHSDHFKETQLIKCLEESEEHYRQQINNMTLETDVEILFK